MQSSLKFYTLSYCAAYFHLIMLLSSQLPIKADSTIQPVSVLYCITVEPRAGTNTPSDEYDSYREYRVANTNMYSRIQ